MVATIWQVGFTSLAGTRRAFLEFRPLGEHHKQSFDPSGLPDDGPAGSPTSWEPLGEESHTAAGRQAGYIHLRARCTAAGLNTSTTTLSGEYLTGLTLSLSIIYGLYHVWH